jgi:uncharacterized protein YcsI (UPF0317 family)
VSFSTQSKIGVQPRPLSTGHKIRLAAREGPLTTSAGLALGYVQGNLAVLPASIATDFLRFAQRNPKPRPLIGVYEPGSRTIPELGLDLDVATDIPRLVARRTHRWADIGCRALARRSGDFRHRLLLLREGPASRQRANVTMYRTSIAAQAADGELSRHNLERI